MAYISQTPYKEYKILSFNVHEYKIQEPRTKVPNAGMAHQLIIWSYIHLTVHKIQPDNIECIVI
jgi:hypothetical protein